ncbi:hypothetical protein CC80DRAFT_540214 [Byssothecium circinans]|uniref:DUF1772-domain-containing protein n=1 Tax=Byssothecium circinans TaxID=147558 RepID=A0A6A5TB69_9PLEO|nr:hypothetical protein CC80DRAFT_540214 [Byssothecium circinans]
MGFESPPSLVHTLQTIVPVSLIFLSGVSACLSLWVMPLTQLLPPKQAARQSFQTVVWGGQYLQSSARALAASLLITTVLTSQLADPKESAKWKTWAFCTVLLPLVAPYEIKLIFPLNDRIDDLGRKMEAGEELDAVERRELTQCFKSWGHLNYGRVALPLVSGVVALLNRSS